MKYYTYNGKTTKQLPDPLNLIEGGCVSPMTEERFVAFGGVITEDQEPTPMEEFEAALVMFRAVCNEIAQFLGVEQFLGGFGDIAAFETSETAAANPVMALMLSSKWNAADKLCTYLGSKVGYGQPKWFYYCWGIPMPTTVEVPEGAQEADIEPDPAVLAMLEQQAQEPEPTEPEEPGESEPTEEPTEPEGEESEDNEEPEEESEAEIVDNEDDGSSENSAEPS